MEAYLGMYEVRARENSIKMPRALGRALSRNQQDLGIRVMLSYADSMPYLAVYDRKTFQDHRREIKEIRRRDGTEGVDILDIQAGKESRIDYGHELARYAQIGDEAMIIGAFLWIEIWNRDAFLRYTKRDSGEKDIDMQLDAIQRIIEN